MDSMKNVLKEALSLVKPAKQDEEEADAKVNDIAVRFGKSRDFKIILGGSGAKGTWLKGAYDIDFFVLFNYNKYRDKSDKISDMLEAYLKKRFNSIIRLHGSRDYFQIRKGRFTLEIVPILEIRNAKEAMNITDVSPLHSKWVKKHKKLNDEIRLLKQFCKANRCYGAESYIQGFSGYICEILTVYYGSFLNVMKNAAKWNDKVIIDAEGYYKGKDALFELNKSKTVSPLVVIDPVQKDRNAAAALSKERFEIFREACREFIKRPGIVFFIPRKLSIEELKKKAGRNKLIICKAAPLKGKEDIVGCRLMKAFEHIRKQLEHYEFRIIHSGWEWDKSNQKSLISRWDKGDQRPLVSRWDKKGDALFYFILDAKPLEQKRLWTGPFVKSKEHVAAFKKKYKEIFIKNNRAYAMVRRKYTRPEELFADIKKDPYVKERCKGLRKVL